MSSRILDLSNAPEDPVERLAWLGGVQKQVDREMEPMWAEAYFWARFSGRLDAALALGLHSRKSVMAHTRAWNEQAGRMIRWNDQRQ